MTATADSPARTILLADSLDMEAIRSLAHRVRQYRKVRQQIQGLEEEIRRGSFGDKDARLAVITWLLEKTEDAINHAEKAGNHPVALMLRGAQAQRQGDHEKALKFYQQAGQLAPSSSPCTLRQLGALRALKREEEALALIDKLEREFGDKPNLYFHKGRCLEQLGRYEEAIGSYRHALQIDAEHAESLFHLARLLDLRGEDEEAMHYYERIGPDSANTYVNALLNLALIYDDRDRYQDAIRCCEMVLRTQPNNNRAKLYLDSAEASLTMYYSPEENKQNERLEAVLRVPVSDFELSVRSRNCLAKMNISTLGDLVKRTESELLAYKNFGETSLREIREILNMKGLRLGMMREDAATRAAFGRAKNRAREELLSKGIDELELSVRSRKAMEALNIHTIGDICDHSETELSSIKNFGRVSLNEIKKRLQELGLGLKDAKN